MTTNITPYKLSFFDPFGNHLFDYEVSNIDQEIKLPPAEQPMTLGGIIITGGNLIEPMLVELGVSLNSKETLEIGALLK